MTNGPGTQEQPREDDGSLLRQQLATIWNARGQQDQVLWRIFGAFWPTNAILLVALFRGSDVAASPWVGVIVCSVGIFVAAVWFLIQQRAIGHIKRIEATAERLERHVLREAAALFALTPKLNVSDAKVLQGPSARLVMPVCTGIVGSLWLIGGLYFIAQPGTNNTVDGFQARHVVNTIGLLLDIVGAILIWRYGLPAQIDPEGRQFIVTSDRDAGEIAKAKRYRRFQHWGVGLLVMGFSLQAASNWLT